MNRDSFDSSPGSNGLSIRPDFISLTRAVVSKDLLTEDRPLLGFVDIEGVKQTVAALKQAFPDHFDHYFAEQLWQKMVAYCPGSNV